MIRFIISLLGIVLVCSYIDDHPVETLIALGAMFYVWQKGN
ncbi:hypothetical protein [Brevibacillus agri]|nr:hypothetical protein [Brevibacillus agri]